MNVTSQVLKSLLLESKDGEWGKSEPFDDAVKMGVVRGTDFASVRSGHVTTLPVRYIPLRIAKRKTLQPNDIILETAGGSKNRSTGRTVFVKPALVQRAALPLTCASFSRFIRIDPHKVDPRYLFWHLQYLYEYGHLHKYHTQHTGVARFQYTLFAENEELDLPALSTQRNIASILSAYDDLIENNARRIEVLEEMAQRIYREWFVHFRFPGHEKAKMVESELGAIPSGWAIRKLEHVCVQLTSGGTPARKQPDYWGGNIGWFKTKELKDGFLFHSEELVTDEGLRRSAAKLFPAGTVLMAIYAAPTVGRLGILTEPATFNQAACGLVADPQQLTPSFLYLKLYELRGYFNSLAQGAAQQNISVQKVRDSQMVLPIFDVIEKFDVIASPLLSQVKTLSEKNANLRRTRDLLLPKLISGEVSVEDLDVDPEERSQ